MADNKLNQKQNAFTRLLFEGKSQREAYSTVYDVAGQAIEVIDSHASRLASNGKVLARLEELNSKVDTKKVADVQERREVLTEIVRGRLGDFIHTDGELIEVNKDKLKSAALQELKTTRFTYGKDGQASEKTTTIKVRDPITAIAELNKMEKVYETGGIHIDKIEVTIIEGQPPPGYARPVPIDVKAGATKEPREVPVDDKD